jgi:hypothetical protein
VARKLFLTAGCALFVALVVKLGPWRIAAMLADLGWGFAVIVGLYAVHQLARTAALRGCLADSSKARYVDVLLIRVAGEAVAYLTFTGPFLAEPTRAWLLKRHGLTTEEGFAAALTEYLTYTLLATAFSIAALGVLLARFTLTGAAETAVLVTIVAMSVFLAAAVLAIVFRIYLVGFIIERLAALPVVRRRWRPDPSRVRKTEDLLLRVLRDSPGRLLRIVAFDAAAQAALIVELFWIMKLLALVFPPVYPVLIEAGSKLANTAFFFVPARIGAAEGVMTVMFGIVGLPAAAGLTVSIARRLRSLIVALIGGIVLSSLSRGAADATS